MKPFSVIIAAAALSAASPFPKVETLSWLRGHWEVEDSSGWTEEIWLEPRGGAMMGMSRSGNADGMRSFEFLRITSGEDGVPVYLASPGGKPAVAFRLVDSAPGEAVFANPAHDFPQRIRYKRSGDTLEAAVSRTDGSSAETWTYGLRTSR